MLLTSAVDAVTLYSDRARVLRRSKAALEKGTARIEIRDLPHAMDKDSARVRLKGRARVLSFDLAVVNFAEPPATDARDLERLIEEKTDAVSIIARAVQKQTEKISSALSLTQESRMFARGLASGRMDLARQKEIYTFADATHDQASAELATLDASRRLLEKEIARARADLALHQAGRSRQRIDAVIDVDCSESGEVEVEFVYVTPNAWWRPVYDLRFGEKLELHYMATAAQSTGENWTNVSIELSTAAVSESESIPEFGTWLLSPFVPMPPPMQPRGMPAPAPAPGMRAASVAIADSAIVGDYELGGFAEAEIRAGAVVSYGVSARTSIPGNGETKKLTIGLSEFASSVDYVLAPSLQEVAYRRAEFENTSELLLLPGTAQVFYADDLTGKTELEETPPGSKRKVFLGVESRIQVKRKLAGHEADKKFLGDDRRLRWDYRIEIENLLEKEARILLREQIPVSTQEQIKVKFECAEKPEQKDMGTLEWTFAVAARAKKVLEYSLTIEHPRSMQVTGLP